MNTRRIRLNAMTRVKDEVRKYFNEQVQLLKSEEQYGSAQTQRREGNIILRVINDVIKKEA